MTRFANVALPADQVAELCFLSVSASPLHHRRLPRQPRDKEPGPSRQWLWAVMKSNETASWAQDSFTSLTKACVADKVGWFQAVR